MRQRSAPSRPLANSPAVAGYRPAGVALAIAGAFSGALTGGVTGAFVGPAHAQSTGLQAIHGTASMATQGNKTIITTQNGAGTSHSALNWQSFGVAPGTTTQFNQPSAASTAINRVLGNNPSAIFGTLSSNGRLVLVNPAGIAVGAGAVVDTAGFTASTLRMTDADALAGRMRFGDGGMAGGVSVGGQIVARGGDVVLIAPNVETSQGALIQSPGGATVLAAGQKVEVTGRGLEGIHLQVQAPQDSAVNLGQITGDAVGIFAGTLKHSGLISATQVSTDGGKVVLKGQDAADISGSIMAAKGSLGGQIHATASKVKLRSGAVIDASGAAGGGEVLLGGGWQGKDARIANAAEAVAETGSTIRADATGNGNGGTVVLWADGSTRFDGTISARGGASGGDGGMVETSGKQTLGVAHGRVDARAPAGRTGTWLLDPTNITLAGGTGATPDTVYEDALEAAGANQIINASGTITASGTFSGGDVTMPAGLSLTLNGDAGIDLTTSTHGTALALKTFGASGTIALNTVSGAINAGTLKAAGGAVSLVAGGTGTLQVRDITTNPLTDGPGGAITLQSGGAMTLGAAGSHIDARGTGIGATSGNVTITSGGAVTMQSSQNIYANDLQISAAGGITDSANSLLRIDAARLQARNSGPGDIKVLSVGMNGVTLDNLGGGQAVSQGTAGGSVYIGSTQGVLTVNAAIATTNGDVLLESDRMALVGTTNAGTANVTLKANAPATVIDLGSATDVAAGRLELSNSELGTVTAGILKIGNNANQGGIQITDNVSMPNATQVSLINNGSISQSAGKTITTDKLNAHSHAGSVTLAEANAVNTVAGKAGSGGTFSFKSAGALTVGTVDINSGVEVTNGAISVESPGLLTVGQNVTGGTGTITLQGVGVTLGAARTVNAQNVVLEGTTGAVNTGTGTVTAGTGVFVNSGTTVTLGQHHGRVEHHHLGRVGRHQPASRHHAQHRCALGRHQRRCDHSGQCDERHRHAGYCVLTLRWRHDRGQRRRPVHQPGRLGRYRCPGHPHRGRRHLHHLHQCHERQRHHAQGGRRQQRHQPGGQPECRLWRAAAGGRAGRGICRHRQHGRERGQRHHHPRWLRRAEGQRRWPAHAGRGPGRDRPAGVLRLADRQEDAQQPGLHQNPGRHGADPAQWRGRGVHQPHRQNAGHPERPRASPATARPSRCRTLA
jgi:filamentous hemagglutinin family protein